MISLVIFDFDGTFTDGIVYFNEEHIIKKYNTIDGMGIKLLHDNNIKTCIITGYKETTALKNICSHLNINYLFENTKNKIDILIQLKKELNINNDNIAYIGDDINDYEILKEVKIKGCVKNADKKLLNICNFISERDGGYGAVREFCEYIINKNNSENENEGILCLVPVRMNSTRLYGKPLYKFGNKTMIQMLYEKINNIKEIKKIVLLTDSEEIKEHVNTFNAECIIINDFCNSGTHRIMHYLNKYNINDEYILNIQGDEPFINIANVKSCIQSYLKYKYDNTIKCFCLHGVYENNDITNKKFVKCLLNKQNNIVYMSRSNIPTKFINLGSAFIIETHYLKTYFEKSESLLQINEDVEWNNIIDNGYKIYSTLVNDFERSIDTIEDYNYILKKYNIDNNIKILDCTIRDGGFENGWLYEYNYVKKLMINSNNCNLYAFEIGYIINDEFVQNGMGQWRNVSFEVIKQLKKETNLKSKISVMIDIWRYDFNKLPNKKDTEIDIIRLCVYPDKLLDFINIYQKVNELGYEVSINIIAVSHLNNTHFNNINKLIIEYNNFFHYLYLADSFGNLNIKSTENIIKNIIKNIKKYNIILGFHSHNNGNIALSNTLKAIELGASIIDATYGGIGRGGGNLILEDFLLYNYYFKNYNLNIEELFIFLIQYYNNDKTKINYLKDMICGFLNVHPYRLRIFNNNNNNLLFIHNELSLLNNEDKKTY